jgi:uracil-DNA glycosylase
VAPKLQRVRATHARGRGAQDELRARIPASWASELDAATRSPSFGELAEFLAAERAHGEVFPPANEVFAAFEHTPRESTRVVVLGQDPYHGAGQSHGLCFSVRPGVAHPPSLRNIFKELRADCGAAIPRDGCLVNWAEQGVLLVNAVLTVRSGEAGSHRGRGWEEFTDAVIASAARLDHVVFVLWGNDARRKARAIDPERHTLIECAHPSPLSARRFFGSRPFSRTNAALRAHGQREIDWSLGA